MRPEAAPNGPNHRSHRTLRAGVAVIVATIILGACVGQREPTGYSAKVGRNFVAGCTAGYTPKGSKTDPKAAEHTKFCRWLYSEISNKKTGISFDEFKNAQAKIREDPTNPANAIDKLIPNFDELVRSYKADTSAGPTSPGK